MKNQSGALLYFSGYPLRIANAKPQKSKGTKSNLSIIKSPGPLKKHNMANDPKNWDEGWFCNYE
jgi:hypothetical protein